ncbi:carbohydrate-binding module family 48 protein [Gregarina niphandrodes]|uniref:Carbohydrate-binding module family 48 protein n=1 Tax=Gregarina niphandrodes TaxID=110365 RepID=A0A023BAF7_GRENI|nr:carbohydrate-binding module family 48 protein [Gregarina niphandrodes]EZG78270.1 carbohydrate-binding module family 48 protein [Gregarina niphandrodes]|eukprot:XP_011129375.1 carbohydrate-binding module family 48 protein [Gregarina niphandrodes]
MGSCKGCYGKIIMRRRTVEEEEEAESAAGAVEEDELEAVQVLGMGPLRVSVETEAEEARSSSTSSVCEDLVSCVFTWAHGGHEVFLTGSFNDWSARVKMVKAGHEFVTALELPRGKHSYKFVVDDIWKFAPDQETATDEHGFVNNVIDISDHQHFRCVDLQPTLTNLNFSQDIPELTEYTSDAPAIPLLFSKVQCPATHPPPPLIAPLHGLANHIYHDSSVTTAIG